MKWNIATGSIVTQINFLYIKVYLSRRTILPTTIPTSRINGPPEIKIGVANPISKVTSLSGFGNLAGIRVASKKPSESSIKIE